MNTLVDDSAVTNGLEAFLVSRFGDLEIGDTDAPDVAEMPFTEITQLADGRDPSGGDHQPLSVRWLKFQLLTVAQNREAAQLWGHWIMEAIFEMNPVLVGGYVNDIPVDSHAIIDRELTSNLGVVDSGRAKGHLMHVRFGVQRTS